MTGRLGAAHAHWPVFPASPAKLFGSWTLFMFWKRKSKSVPAERNSFAIPAGQRVYAIGDIHGRDDLFAELIGLLRADNSAPGPARVTLILLGDLVDRGPQSDRKRVVTGQRGSDRVDLGGSRIIKK